MHRRHILPFAALLIGAASSHGQSAPAPTRWGGNSANPEDFEFHRDSSVAHTGRASIQIIGREDPAGFASVAAGASAAAYAGKRVTFSGFLRSASLTGGGGALWLRADDANHRSVAFLNTQTQPVRGTTDWKRISISLDIPASANQIVFGALIAGAGSLWFDDAELTADSVAVRQFGFENPSEVYLPQPIPRAAVTREAPRALSATGLANVGAFTQALGYIRFFHPAAAAVTVNWDAFAVHGVRAVERATTPDSLASTLQALFTPIAPTVVFARTGAPIRTTIAKPADATRAVFWMHQGVGVPSGGFVANPVANAYRSERVVVPLDSVGKLYEMSSRWPTNAFVSRPIVPDPAHPLALPLEGDVTLSLPVALFTADTTVPESLRSPKASPVAERFTASDRATRLADVALAWSLFQQFYPYFDIVKTDWAAVRTSALQAAATDRDATAFQHTMERLVAALHDGHGNVGRTSGTLTLPDIHVDWAEGRVFVTAAGDSAIASGARVGDEVVAVDGVRTDSALAQRSELISGATPQWIRSRALGVLLNGEPDVPVRLRLKSPVGDTRDVRVERHAIFAPTPEPKLAKIADVATGVMYVDLGRITDADFSAALPRLAEARAVIFDMRGYPRQVNTPAILMHLTDTVIHSAHFELPLITMPDRRSVGYVDGAWTLQPMFPRFKGRAVFLTAGGAISYAESTLGTVEAYHLADIVGEPSAGTNGNVNPFALPGGYSITWTGMLVQKRDGTPHHGVGVIPTIPVSPTAAGLRAGRDEILERAIALVSTPVVP